MEELKSHQLQVLSHALEEYINSDSEKTEEEISTAKELHDKVVEHYKDAVWFENEFPFYNTDL